MTLNENYLVFMYEDDLQSEDYLSSALKNKSRIGVTQFSNAGHLAKNLLLEPDMVIIDYKTFKERKTQFGEDVFKELQSSEVQIPVIVVAPASDRPFTYDFDEDRLIEYTEKNELCLNRLKETIADYREVKILKKRFRNNPLRRAAAFSITIAAIAAFFLS